MTKRGGEGDDSIMKCIETLAHASQCTQDDSCPEKESCRRMANVLSHARQCRLRNSCPVCRQLVALCVTHSRKCTVLAADQKCPIPFCAELRVDLNRRRQEQRQHQQRMVDCRLAVMTASQSTDAEAVREHRPASCVKNGDSQLHASEMKESKPADLHLPVNSARLDVDNDASSSNKTVSTSCSVVQNRSTYDTQVLLTTDLQPTTALSLDNVTSHSPGHCADGPLLSQEGSELSSTNMNSFEVTTDISLSSNLDSYSNVNDDVISKGDCFSEVVPQQAICQSTLQPHRRGNRQLADIANHLPTKSSVSCRTGEDTYLKSNSKSQSFQNSYTEFLIGSSSTTHIYIQSLSGSKTIVQFNSGDAGPIDSNDLLAHLADRL